MEMAESRMWATVSFEWNSFVF